MADRRSCPSHCCGRHGCKYGYEDCPVVIGSVKQKYPCERCKSIREAQTDVIHAIEELEWSEKVFK